MKWMRLTLKKEFICRAKFSSHTIFLVFVVVFFLLWHSACVLFWPIWSSGTQLPPAVFWPVSGCGVVCGQVHWQVREEEATWPLHCVCLASRLTVHKPLAPQPQRKVRSLHLGWLDDDAAQKYPVRREMLISCPRTKNRHRFDFCNYNCIYSFISTIVFTFLLDIILMILSDQHNFF